MRPSRLRLWYRAKHPVFRFVSLLTLLLVLCEIIASGTLVHDRAVPAYQRLCARMSAAAMRVFGEDATVSDCTIMSPRFIVDIKRGCDAVQPTVLFVSAVLASPVAWWTKLPGILAGLAFLVIMNQVRVISLFYIGAFCSHAVFDIMHHDVWQAAFILLSVLAWGLWAVWAVRVTRTAPHATA
ncbi:MAG: archaeosortase/exosortase family protein [Planctomycetes bacterium]|nr:archaeosortase/exosortase family protein [Planctomycetota bacterium]